MRLSLSCLLVVMLSASATEAAPIAVSAGETIIFNFDLTAATPAPPYFDVSVFTGMSGFEFPGDAGLWQLWEGLNGTGSLSNFSNLGLSSFGSSEAGITDGVFSLKLTMTAGSIEVDPSAIGVVLEPEFAETGRIFPTIVRIDVPEPAMLALFGMGLAAAVRRRRNGSGVR